MNIETKQAVTLTAIKPMLIAFLLITALLSSCLTSSDSVEDTPNNDTDRVSIPEAFYKAIITGDLTKGIGFLIPHAESSAEIEEFVVSIDSLESLIGLDLRFNNHDIDSIEAQNEPENWF